MKTLKNCEILDILNANCTRCEKDSCFLHHLVQTSSEKSLSARINIEKKNKISGIVDTLQGCTLIDPKITGDLTL